MRTNITARHFKASDKLKDFAEKKVLKLNKYYDGIIDCEILLESERHERIADISLNVYSQKLQAVEKSEEFEKSIELCVDKLERQLKKYKEKLKAHSPVEIESEE